MPCIDLSLADGNLLAVSEKWRYTPFVRDNLMEANGERRQNRQQVEISRKVYIQLLSFAWRCDDYVDEIKFYNILQNSAVSLLSALRINFGAIWMRKVVRKRREMFSIRFCVVLNIFHAHVCSLGEETRNFSLTLKHPSRRWRSLFYLKL